MSLEKISKQKVLHRVCGQSGSGKTTQVVKSIVEVLNNQKVVYCHLAVRNFSKLHPNYNFLLNKFGKKHIRERTNGFALKCLVYVLKILFKLNVLILLEITLLGKVFESFVLNLSKQYEYEIKFHILSVPTKVSNEFIKQRNKKHVLELEQGRLTYKKSVSYFNNTLIKSFKFLQKQKGFNPRVVVWNAYDFLPCFYGDFKHCKKAFYKCRKIVRALNKSERQLYLSKVDFYQNNFLL